VAYLAEIQIAVRGARELQGLQTQLDKSAQAVDRLNRDIQTLSEGGIPRSINNLSRLVANAADSFNDVALGTKEATDAARDYVRVTDQLNTGLRERAELLKQITEQERKAKLAAAGIKETTQYGGPIGPGQASPVALSSQLRGRTEQILAERKGAKELEEVLATLEERRRLETNATLDQKAASVALQAERKKEKFLAGTTQYAGPIGPGPASAVNTLVGQTSPVAERVRSIIQSKQDEAALQAALLRLEEKSAAVLNEKVQSQQNLVRGTQEVYELLARQQQRASFLAGKSGTLMQGPLAGAGAMGFPVALPMTAAEQEGLRTAAQKQQILQRMAATRQQLVGLAANLQRLDQNSAVAIADAKRAQESLNLARERELQIAKEVSAIRSREGAASVAARQRLASEAARRQLIQNAGFGVQGPALPPTAAASRSGGGVGGRIGGAISGSIIGGAFPLLFGQSGGAAAGGAIGGLVGGLAGPGGSFAGSLLGTLLGEIASKGQAIKQLGEDIGFSTQQTKQLSDAFKVANTDVDKFTAVIQNIRGVGLALEDQAKAIQLVTRLTEAYGGSFEKTGNSITSALESGKVTQATLNQLTSQGINIQQALADKYKVSRSEILKMAKDGEISVQSLIDTLVEVANAGTAGATKVRSSYEEAATAMSNAFTNATTGINNSFISIQNTATTAFERIVLAITPAVVKLAEITGKVISLGVYVVELGVKFASAFYAIPGTIQVVATAISNMIPGLSATYTVLSNIARLAGAGKNRGGLATSLNLNAGMDGANWPAGIPRPGTPVQSFTVPSEFGPTGGAGKKGPKPPEDRTALLREDLEAMKLMSVTQDGIRDALFEGNKELAIRLEYDQKVADINRDTAKALLNANYETEKTVIRAQEIVRLKDAQLQRDDELRELARDIDEAVKNTLDDLRGGITWDDTGMREIFDMRLPDAIKEIQENITALTDPTNQIIGAATAIGDAFSASFKGIVSGAMTAREGLSNFFKSVGDYFIDMAARIAAEALKLQAIQLLQRLLNPLGFAASDMSLPGLTGTGALSNGPMFAGGAFAEGGFVTGPTRALIGEGGEPEYVIPQSKMSAAMSRYSRGARGESVIAGSGSSSESGGTATAPMAPIDVRYSVERINNVDYVTADQFRAGMAHAAQQGAIQGERRAMRSLKNSAATRRSVGV
jgi:tape measure domain-containing protein